MIQQPQVIYRKNYQPSSFLIKTTDLLFELGEEVTTVTARSSFKTNPETKGTSQLLLDGQDLKLKSIKINGDLLAEDDYELSNESLLIKIVPQEFELEIVTEIKPQQNKTLMGLYKSSGNFCTQCESHGFQRITYYLDRPDVMASFTTTIIADKQKYPVLLSNGNLVEESKLGDDKHMAKWQDPFIKPCYLFALVAGDLGHIEDHFTTVSGRKVTLRIFSEHKNVDKCSFAMEALKKSMKWDEENYGREYDLDIFMIVAVDDFNFGAMENKGLNVFNTQYVLAKPETATDQDYAAIDTVVSHEYFHNWTGDRVTLRDWFQLTLKEGLTVFRDHSFSEDVGFSDVVRIEQVTRLRNLQFPEDAGPLAHPIRPDSYIEMNNFYTATVYEKGSEIIRMQKTFLGAEGYRKGTDLYFERHDGNAVTCEDFLEAMEDANGADFSQFRRWYEQAGTPQLDVSGEYYADQQKYHLTVKQSCPATPGQAEKKPFQLPLKLGLLNSKGQDMPLTLKGERDELKESVLNITQPEETFVFSQIVEKPVPSLLRGFSAPVKLNYAYSEAELAFLMAHDSDAFARWEAGQKFAISQLQAAKHSPKFIEALRKILTDPQLDKAFIATMLQLPTENYLSELAEVVDPDLIHQSRQALIKEIASQLENELLAAYQANHSNKAYQYVVNDAAERLLKNVCLSYLCSLEKAEYYQLALEQFETANNMTDQLSALSMLSYRANAHRDAALAAFYQQWQQESLVVNKWFAVQACADLLDILDKVKSLMEHPAFNLENPNKVRALLGGLTGNLVHFHQKSGVGYEFLADQVLKIDGFNPMIASRLVTSLCKWRRYDKQRQALMKAQLERILAKATLSKNTYEIVSKALG